MSNITMFLADATSAITGGATAACGTSCNTGTTINSLFANISNVLIFLVGSISVIMIIIGGLRYVLSNGDAKQAAAAKDTILYAVIGVVVAIIAFAIIKFVTTSIK
jgi:cytochrome bd-type quinol oxidase subunit 2